MPATPVEKIFPKPLFLLKGTYATSYVGYIQSVPGPKPPLPGPPNLPAYVVNPAGTGFVQVAGYRLHSFAANLCFHGDGKLSGNGYSNVAGINPKDLIFTGDYTVDVQINPTGFVHSGTFATVDTQNIRVEYYWIMSDNWRRLEFMVLQTLNNGAPYRPFVVAGTLTRI